MSNTPLHRNTDAARRPGAAARAAKAAAAIRSGVFAGAASLALTGCSSVAVAPEDEPPSVSRSVLKKISFATDATPPADFVISARRPPDSLEYIPIGAPKDEPKLQPADKAQVEKRLAAVKAIKPGRGAVAAGRPTMQAAPQLPASALQAKQEHDERMRERASPAE